ncbi:hypothetical protein Tco_0044323 [Tanacetum coccineum]
MVVEGEVLNDFLRFVGVLIAEFAAGGVVNLALKMRGDMIIKNLDLEPTIDAMMRDFLEISLRSFAVLPGGVIEQGIGYLWSFVMDLVSATGDKVSTANAATTLKGLLLREPGESTTTTTIPISSKIQDKGKAKMIKPKLVKKLSKKDQLKLDEEMALKLQAEIDEEERIPRAEEEKD